LLRVSGTNLRGKMSKRRKKERTNILLIPVLMAKVTRRGERKQPNCPRPSMEPAPIDSICKGKD
jgi:hypothetical protein